MSDSFSTYAAMFDRQDRANERTDHCGRCRQPDHHCRCHQGARILQFPATTTTAASGCYPDTAA